MVGLAVVLLSAALIAGGLWLSVGFDQKKYTIYAVYMHEAVSGLSEDSAVKYNGVQVGSVLKIELSHIDPQLVKILLNIEDGTPVTTSTTATLISQGITGTTYVGLSTSSSDLTPLQKLPQEPYPIIPSKPSLFNQLDSVLKEVSENVNSVSLELKQVFDQENILNLKKSLANLQKFTDVIASNSKNIDQSLKNTDTLLKNIAKVSDELPEAMRELKNSAHKMGTMATNISQAGVSVTAAMDAGKITIDKISQQAIPPAVTLLRRLDTIAANLEKVSTQMRQNPSVVIRGNTPPAPGPGE